MKWFKHFTDSLDDPFIQELLDVFSHSGYVAFFGLIEIIAKENGHEITGDLEISPAYLKRKLRISQAKLQQIFEFCSTKGKLFSDFTGEKWKFSFPKIAELKDNYTKDLQATSKKPSKHKEVEVEVEKKEIKKKKAIHLPKDFIISDRVKKWAEKNNHTNLEQHLENFKIKALAKGYTYVDWDSAFQGAIRDNWANLSNDVKGDDWATPEQIAAEEARRERYEESKRGI